MAKIPGLNLATSNFSVSGKLPNAVAISQGVPKGWQGKRYLALAPSWDLVKEKDEAVYAARYQVEVLAKLDPETVAQELGTDAVLLCWEKAGEFCHRRLVAAWLQEALGIDVHELAAKKAEPLPTGTVQIKFAEKPAQATLARIKKAGFKWSGKEKAWNAEGTEEQKKLAEELNLPAQAKKDMRPLAKALGMQMILTAF